MTTTDELAAARADHDAALASAADTIRTATELRDARILAALDSGWTQADVARATGWSRETIRQITRRRDAAAEPRSGGEQAVSTSGRETSPQ